ncbi:MAG: ATP-binding protein, partial [Pseudomonadota bacterium]
DGSAGGYAFALPNGRHFEANRRRTSDGGFVLAWRDVTEQRAAERELARRREASFQSEKLTALGELLAGVAHELNNLLSVVVGQSLMLCEDLDDPTHLRRAEKIGTAAERCAKIVKTFLAMARQRPAQLAPVALDGVVETALDVVGERLRSDGITLERALAAGLPPVSADEDQITQVIVNLLVNAQQALAGRTGARVRVTAERGAAPTTLTVRIEDNGPGVPPDLRQRIFEPFFTIKDVGEGTGVGLALSHRIAAAHGGHLEVGESALGGASFSLSLPLAETAVSTGVPTEAEEPPASLQALLVEDEPDVGDMIEELLSLQGIAVTRAENGERALALLAPEHRYDLVLSDLRMPGMGGRRLFDALAERRPDLVGRIAFITGDAMSAEAEEIRKRRDLTLLEKPVSPIELRALVRRLAGRP